MATYYWVGGAGPWNASSTTNWASSSGGAGGAGVPTSADDVVFDTNSGTGNLTVTGNCRNLTVTVTQSMMFSGGTGPSVYGSVSLPTGGSFTWYTVPLILRATTTGNTLNFGDKPIQQNVTFNGAGGEWTLQSNMSCGAIVHSNGTLTTNNFNISAGSYTSAAGNTPVLNLGSSTVTISGSGSSWNINSNLTVNAGTSNINLSAAASTTFNGAGKTYYNLTFSAAASSNYDNSISGVNTFNNLSFTGPNTNGITTIVSFGADQTINGTLSISGTTTTRRVQVQSAVAGTQRTLSIANAPSVTNSNFKDIALTGAASPWTAPLGVFDLGNNTGITFDTTTLYWIGGTGNWTDGTHWSTSSGGSAANAIPGPTNNVIFNSASNATAYTVTGTGGYCKDFTMAGPASGKVTWNIGSTFFVYGSVDLSVGTAQITKGSSGTVTFAATTTGKTINFGDIVISCGVTFNGAGGGWTLQSPLLSGNGGSFTLNAGSLDTAGYAVTALTFSATTANTASLSLGSSAVTMTSVSFDFSGSGFTLNAGTSTITSTYYFSKVTFNGGGKTYYNVVFTLGDLSYNNALPGKTIVGENTFNNLTFNGATFDGVCGVALNGTQTINGTLTVNGGSTLRRVVFYPNDFVTQRTITAAAVSLTDTDFVKINGAGTATWAGTRIGDGGGNSGITFDTPKTVYWNLAAGGSFLQNGWATSSGGAVASTNYPLGQDTAIIEDTGLNSGADIYASIASMVLPNLTFATRTLPVTFTIGNTTFAAGNITLSSAVTRSGTHTLYFSGNTTLTSAGVTWTNNTNVVGTLTIADTATFNHATTHTINTGGTLTLNAPITFSAAAIVFASNTTLNLNSYTLTTTGFRSTSLASNLSFNFGTGKVVSTGTSSAIGFSSVSFAACTGTKRIELTATTGTVTCVMSGFNTNTAFNVYVTSLVGTFLDTGSVQFGDLDLTGSTCTVTNSVKTIYGNLTGATGTTWAAGNSGITFAATSGTRTITTNGKTLDFPITFNGVGGTWQLADNLLQGSTRATTLQNGTLDLNGKTYTVGSFETAVGTKNLTFNGGTLVCPAVTTTAFNNAQPTNFTTTAGTGTGKISMTGATAKTFVGGGSTYNCTLEQAGAGALTITGSNTFNDITNTTQPVSVLFTAGTTNTFNNFSLSGTSGNLVTIGSVTAASHTLSKSSGVVNVSYCSISRSTATGGARWQAYTINGNVNGGNNTGWKFSAFSGNGLLFGSNF